MTHEHHPGTRRSQCVWPAIPRRQLGCVAYIPRRTVCIAAAPRTRRVAAGSSAAGTRVLPVMNIIQALDDPNVFGRQFHGGTWDAWRTFLAALFALPLTPEQLEVYQRHTGRRGLSRPLLN